MALNVSPHLKSQLDAHIQKFTRCVSCPLGKNTKYKIFCRGHVPCEILFVGEAPGEMELLWGQPFVGPSGDLLNELIQKGLSPSRKFCIVNAVVCSPQNTPSSPLRTPNKTEIVKCSIRLREFISIANPSIFIAVGNSAAKSLTALSLPFQKIPHPAAILRQEERGNLDYKRALTLLRSL